MPFFPLLRKRRLASSWQFTTKGVIWRICPGPGRMLIGEERDLESKSTSFFCIDASGTALWKERSFGETWWTGIEALHGGVLFLHGYATPDLPTHLGITAVDCVGGQQLWNVPDALFIGARAERVYAWRAGAGAGRMLELACRSGELLSERAQSEPDLPEAVEGLHIQSPDPLPQSGAEAVALRKLLERTTPRGSEPVGTEYCVYGTFVVFSYALRHREGQSYAQHLCVIDRQTTRVAYACAIEHSAPSPGAGQFIVCEDMLYVVCKRHTLCAVAMGQGRTRV